VSSLRLTLLPGEFSVWRLAADAPQPAFEPGSFLSMTRTDDELSIVSLTTDVPSGARTEAGWRCLKVEGPLAFEMTGVLAALSAPLAKAEIPIFVVSTYDTDYLLVKASDLDKACTTLQGEGYVIAHPTQVKS
jgi:hypothetical protein